MFLKRTIRVAATGMTGVLVSALGSPVFGAHAHMSISSGMEPKTLSWNWNTTGIATPEGSVHTKFVFHPGIDHPDKAFTKDIVLAGVGGFAPVMQPITLNGACSPPHTTTGKSTHAVSMKQKSTQLGYTSYYVKDETTTTIVPGANPVRSPVKVKVRAKDPWSFGTAAQGAAFFYNDAGFDCPFSIYAGTAFPTPTDYPGGVEDVDATIMEFGVRVAPGVLNDPNGFWGDSPGAIDLYSISISSDASQNMTADLRFGQSTSQFALNFTDSFGNAFDPMDPLAIGSIKQQILSAFAFGEVLADLNDVFRVGFVPLGLESYTMGQSSSLELSDVEVPSPGLSTIVVSCGVLALRRRRAQSVS